MVFCIVEEQTSVPDDMTQYGMMGYYRTDTRLDLRNRPAAGRLFERVSSFAAASTI